MMPVSTESTGKGDEVLDLDQDADLHKFVDRYLDEHDVPQELRELIKAIAFPLWRGRSFPGEEQKEWAVREFRDMLCVLAMAMSSSYKDSVEAFSGEDEPDPDEIIVWAREQFC